VDGPTASNQRETRGCKKTGDDEQEEDYKRMIGSALLGSRKAVPKAHSRGKTDTGRYPAEETVARIRYERENLSSHGVGWLTRRRQ